MFGIHRKLKSWADAGLIDADQYAAITGYEQARAQGRFGRRMAGLALFAIVVGVLSVVAANWAFIPAPVKIGVHAVLNIVLAGVVFTAWRRGREGVREGALLLLGGLVLTFIALIGQVFQLGGTLAGALILWQVAILPLFWFFARTGMTVWPAVLAFVMTVVFVAGEWMDGRAFAESSMKMVLVCVLLSGVLLVAGASTVWRRASHIWCEAMQRTGFSLLVVTATLASLLWYDGGVVPGGDRTVLLLSYGAVLIFMLVHGRLSGLRRDDPVFYDRAWWMVLGGVVMAMAPVMLPVESSLLAIASCLLYWAGVGWYAHLAGAVRLLSLAITVLSIRIWFVYVEAAGGLAMTGMGLICGGVFMLFMLYAARYLNKRLARVPAADRKGG